METLFHLTTEELSRICVDAEFDKDDQFIMDEANCIHKDGIIIFKQPIYVKRSNVLNGVVSRIILVKKEKYSNQLYLLAMTETNSDEDRESLCALFDAENCRNKHCITLQTRSADWTPCVNLKEVNHNAILL